MSHQGFETASEALDFIFGGNATFTLTSTKSGKHFTYKASSPKGDDTAPIFVKVLNGPDNSWNGDWMYLGAFFKATDGSTIKKLIAGGKGHPDAPSFKALMWSVRHLDQKGELPVDLTIQHEDKCGRCGRKLTDPVSISTGIGPECRKKG
jgi:hypothetical protein